MTTTLRTPDPGTVDVTVDTAPDRRDPARETGSTTRTDRTVSIDRLIATAKRFTRQLDEAGLNERERATFFFD